MQSHKVYKCVLVNCLLNSCKDFWKIFLSQGWEVRDKPGDEMNSRRISASCLLRSVMKARIRLSIYTGGLLHKCCIIGMCYSAVFGSQVWFAIAAELEVGTGRDTDNYLPLSPSPSPVTFLSCCGASICILGDLL